MRFHFFTFFSQISPKPPNIVSIRRIHTNSRLFIRFYAHKGSFSGVVCWCRKSGKFQRFFKPVPLRMSVRLHKDPSLEQNPTKSVVRFRGPKTPIITRSMLTPEVDFVVSMLEVGRGLMVCLAPLVFIRRHVGDSLPYSTAYMSIRPHRKRTS